MWSIWWFNTWEYRVENNQVNWCSWRSVISQLTWLVRWHLPLVEFTLETPVWLFIFWPIKWSVQIGAKHGWLIHILWKTLSNFNWNSGIFRTGQLGPGLEWQNSQHFICVMFSLTCISALRSRQTKYFIALGWDYVEFTKLEHGTSRSDGPRGGKILNTSCWTWACWRWLKYKSQIIQKDVSFRGK